VVGGESVSMGFLPFTWGLPALPVMLFAVFAAWAAALFVGWAVALLFPGRFLNIATTAGSRPGASLVAGLVSFPLVLVAMIVLSVTIIGIPVAFLLPFAYVFLGFVGQLATTSLLGARLIRRPLASGLMAALFSGTLLVASAFALSAFTATGEGAARPVALFFLILAMMLVFVLTCVGTGAGLLSRLGSIPGERAGATDPATAPTAGPTPSPGAAG
jgi:hypothetical protein